MYLHTYLPIPMPNLPACFQVRALHGPVSADLHGGRHGRPLPRLRVRLHPVGRHQLHVWVAAPQCQVPTCFNLGANSPVCHMPHQQECVEGSWGW